MDDAHAATESAVHAQAVGEDVLAQLQEVVKGASSEHPAESSHMSDEEYQELFRRIEAAPAATQAEYDRIIAEFMAQREKLIAQAKEKKLEELRQKVAA